MASRKQSTGLVSTNPTNAGSLSGSFGSLPAVGNFILVQTWAWNSAQDINYPSNGCSDNQGNTYQLAIQSDSATGVRTAIYYCERVATSAGTFTITVDPTGSVVGPIDFVATEWAGMLPSNSLAVATKGLQLSLTNTFSITLASGNIVLSDLIAAVVSVDQAITTLVLGTPTYTELAEDLDTANSQIGEAATKLGSSMAGNTVSWTSTGGAPGTRWTGAIAAFHSVDVSTLTNDGTRPAPYKPGLAR